VSLFSKWRAAALYGKALARFHQRRYKNAAHILEKVCRLDPDNERKELQFSYLGRCYLALGRYEESLQQLSCAYESFTERSQSLQRDFDRREFLDFLNAYSDALKRVGQLDRAREVAREAEKYIKAIKA